MLPHADVSPRSATSQPLEPRLWDGVIVQITEDLVHARLWEHTGGGELFATFVRESFPSLGDAMVGDDLRVRTWSERLGGTVQPRHEVELVERRWTPDAWSRYLDDLRALGLDGGEHVG